MNSDVLLTLVVLSFFSLRTHGPFFVRHSVGHVRDKYGNWFAELHSPGNKNRCAIWALVNQLPICVREKCLSLASPALLASTARNVEAIVACMASMWEDTDGTQLIPGTEMTAAQWVHFSIDDTTTMAAFGGAMRAAAFQGSLEFKKISDTLGDVNIQQYVYATAQGPGFPISVVLVQETNPKARVVARVLWHNSHWTALVPSSEPLKVVSRMGDNKMFSAESGKAELKNAGRNVVHNETCSAQSANVEPNNADEKHVTSRTAALGVAADTGSTVEENGSTTGGGAETEAGSEIVAETKKQLIPVRMQKNGKMNPTTGSRSESKAERKVELAKRCAAKVARRAAQRIVDARAKVLSAAREEGTRTARDVAREAKRAVLRAKRQMKRDNRARWHATSARERKNRRTLAAKVTQLGSLANTQVALTFVASVLRTAVSKVVDATSTPANRLAKAVAARSIATAATTVIEQQHVTAFAISFTSHALRCALAKVMTGSVVARAVARQVGTGAVRRDACNRLDVKAAADAMAVGSVTTSNFPSKSSRRRCAKRASSAQIRHAAARLARKNAKHNLPVPGSGSHHTWERERQKRRTRYRRRRALFRARARARRLVSRDQAVAALMLCGIAEVELAASLMPQVRSTGSVGRAVIAGSCSVTGMAPLIVGRQFKDGDKRRCRRVAHRRCRNGYCCKDGRDRVCSEEKTRLQALRKLQRRYDVALSATLQRARRSLDAPTAASLRSAQRGGEVSSKKGAKCVRKRAAQLKRRNHNTANRAAIEATNGRVDELGSCAAFYYADCVPRRNMSWLSPGSFMRGGAGGASTGCEHTDAVDWNSVRRQAATHGRQDLDVGGGGACQFKALAHHLLGDASQHDIVRARAVMELQRHAARYRPFSTEGISAVRWNTYLVKMLEETTWGDALTLYAVATCFRVEIDVIDHTDTVIVAVPFGFDDSAGVALRKIYVCYLPELHYRATMGASTDVAPRHSTTTTTCTMLSYLKGLRETWAAEDDGDDSIGGSGWTDGDVASNTAAALDEGASDAAGAGAEQNVLDDEDALYEEMCSAGKKSKYSPKTIQRHEFVRGLWLKWVDTVVQKSSSWPTSDGLRVAAAGGGPSTSCHYPAGGVSNKCVGRFLHHVYLTRKGSYGHERPCLKTMQGFEFNVRNILANACAWKTADDRKSFLREGASVQRMAGKSRSVQPGTSSPWEVSKALQPLVSKYGKEFTAARVHRSTVGAHEIDLAIIELRKVEHPDALIARAVLGMLSLTGKRPCNVFPTAASAEALEALKRLSSKTSDTRHESQRFEGLKWKDLDAFSLWEEAGRTMVWSTAYYTFTKGLRTGMSLQDFNALTPELPTTDIELMGITQIFELACSLGVFDVQQQNPDKPLAWQLDEMLGKGHAAGNGPQLKIATDCHEWAVFPRLGTHKRFTEWLTGGDRPSHSTKSIQNLMTWAIEEVVGFERGSLTMYSLRKSFWDVTHTVGKRTEEAKRGMNHVESGMSGVRSYAGGLKTFDSGGNRRGVTDQEMRTVPRLSGPITSRIARPRGGGRSRRHPLLSQRKDHRNGVLQSDAVTGFVDGVSQSASENKRTLKNLIEKLAERRKKDARSKEFRETRAARHGRWLWDVDAEELSVRSGPKKTTIKYKVSTSSPQASLKDIVLDALARQGVDTWKPADFDTARSYARGRKFKTQKGWRASSDRPVTIPNDPELYYCHSGWDSWQDFLGKSCGKKGNTKANPYSTFLVARALMKTLNLSGRQAFRLWREKNPCAVPSNPHVFYRDAGWTSWADFLHADKLSCTRPGTAANQYEVFAAARELIRAKRFTDRKSYRSFLRDNKSWFRTHRIPARPDSHYKNSGWISLADWLGYGSPSATTASTKNLAPQTPSRHDHRDCVPPSAPRKSERKRRRPVVENRPQPRRLARSRTAATGARAMRAAELDGAKRSRIAVDPDIVGSVPPSAVTPTRSRRPASYRVDVVSMGSGTCTVHCSGSTTILSVKEQIAASVSLLPSQQIILFQGRELDDNQTMASSGIRGSTRTPPQLQVAPRLDGGMHSGDSESEESFTYLEHTQLAHDSDEGPVDPTSCGDIVAAVETDDCTLTSKRCSTCSPHAQLFYKDDAAMADASAAASACDSVENDHTGASMPPVGTAPDAASPSEGAENANTGALSSQVAVTPASLLELVGGGEFSNGLVTPEHAAGLIWRQIIHCENNVTSATTFLELEDDLADVTRGILRTLVGDDSGGLCATLLTDFSSGLRLAARRVNGCLGVCVLRASAAVVYAHHDDVQAPLLLALRVLWEPRFMAGQLKAMDKRVVVTVSRESSVADLCCALASHGGQRSQELDHACYDMFPDSKGVAGFAPGLYRLLIPNTGRIAPRHSTLRELGIVHGMDVSMHRDQTNLERWLRPPGDYNNGAGCAGAVDSSDVPRRVVAAFLYKIDFNQDVRILLERRGPTPRQWRCPGGKVEQRDATHRSALRRELKEECNIDVSDRPQAMSFVSTEHVRVSNRHFVVAVYSISEWSGDIEALENQELQWFSLRDVLKLDVSDSLQWSLPKFRAQLASVMSRVHVPDENPHQRTHRSDSDSSSCGNDDSLAASDSNGVISRTHVREETHDQPTQPTHRRDSDSSTGSEEDSLAASGPELDSVSVTPPGGSFTGNARFHRSLDLIESRALRHGDKDARPDLVLDESTRWSSQESDRMCTVSSPRKRKATPTRNARRAVVDPPSSPVTPIDLCTGSSSDDSGAASPMGTSSTPLQSPIRAPQEVPEEKSAEYGSQHLDEIFAGVPDTMFNQRPTAASLQSSCAPSPDDDDDYDDILNFQYMSRSDRKKKARTAPRASPVIMNDANVDACDGWTCCRCTFINTLHKQECYMCNAHRTSPPARARASASSSSASSSRSSSAFSWSRAYVPDAAAPPRALPSASCSSPPSLTSSLTCAQCNQTTEVVRGHLHVCGSCDYMDIASYARRYLRVTTFRPLQEDAIRSVMQGNNTSFYAPTGAGKSNVYLANACRCAREFNQVTLYIVPQLSLATNQCAVAQSLGINAIALCAKSNRSTRHAARDMLLHSGSYSGLGDFMRRARAYRGGIVYATAELLESWYKNKRCDRRSKSHPSSNTTWQDAIVQSGKQGGLAAVVFDEVRHLRRGCCTITITVL